jgi:hypothetical protein
MPENSKTNVWRYLILFFMVVAMVVLTTTNGAARGSSTKGMSSDQLARLAVDIHEINNLMSLHAWYHAALMHDVEIEEIWSKRDDIVLWFEASGRFEGPEAIKAGYGRKVSREATRGFFSWHTITTPVVEVAADGQTAKGIWYTPGVAGFFPEGKSNFNWMFEKYGVDFIREDGVWKIWHMHVYSDIGWSLGETIDADGSMGGVPEVLKAIGALGAPPAAGKQDTAPSVKKEQNAGETPYKILTPDTEIELRPRPPEPYKTWSETWSYVDPGE